MNCPICGLKMRRGINMDAAECQDHGVISGLCFWRFKNCSPLEWLIELRGEQALREIRNMAECARGEFR